MTDTAAPEPHRLFGAEHVRRYLETEGREGHSWQGVTTLVLFTRGRRSGEARANALIYRPSGNSLVVVASKGGAPRHPGWYLNLRADPEVEAQVGADRRKLRARVAEGEERQRLWAEMAQVWPAYEEYQTRTPRTIPVVVLDPS